MNFIDQRGGASLGWMNATWPLARLSVTRDELRVKAALIPPCVFTSQDVVRIEPVGRIRYPASGLRIVHTRKDLPAKVVFWCTGSRDQLAKDIAATGFKPAASERDVPVRGNMPFRWSFAIGVLLLWNVMFFLDLIGLQLLSGVPAAELAFVGRHPLGVLSLIATVAITALALALPHVPALQRLALKPEHDVAEVKPLLRLIVIIGALLAIVVAGTVFSQLA